MADNILFWLLVGQTFRDNQKELPGIIGRGQSSWKKNHSSKSGNYPAWVEDSAYSGLETD